MNIIFITINAQKQKLCNLKPKTEFVGQHPKNPPKSKYFSLILFLIESYLVYLERFDSFYLD